MKRLLLLMAVILNLFFTSCNNEPRNKLNKAEIKLLSFNEAQGVAYKYLFYTKNGFELHLTKEEALKKGIKISDYDTIVSRVKLSNKLLRSLKNNDTITIIIDSSKVDSEYLKNNIKIAPKYVTNRLKSYGYNSNSNDLPTNVPAASVDYPYNPNVRIGVPEGTDYIILSGGAECPFGTYEVTLNIYGDVNSILGVGYYSQTKNVTPAMVPSSGNLSIKATCAAHGLAVLHGNF